MNTNPAAKRILVYGDSFTYGWMTWVGRYASNKRFTGVLQQQLGATYEIIEEGLRGRMLAGENAFFPHRDWLQQFPSILWSHLPLDVIIFFLWTNDCNASSNKTRQDIHASLASYAQIISDWVAFFGVSAPNILLVSPPGVQEAHLPPVFQPIFLWGAEKSKQLSSMYASWAKLKWWDFFDANLVVSASPLDGIHIDEQGHEILATHLAPYIYSL